MSMRQDGKTEVKEKMETGNLRSKISWALISPQGRLHRGGSGGGPPALVERGQSGGREMPCPRLALPITKDQTTPAGPAPALGQLVLLH